MSSLAASILASIWHRNRIIFRADDGERADSLFFELRPFIPQYRQVVFCGTIPKEARFLRGAKFIETRDVKALRTALLESLAEEELGAPPVQIVFFRADEAIFRDLLAPIDRGWMATTDQASPAWLASQLKPSVEIKTRRGTVALIDPVPEDVSLEERIMEDTKSLSAGIKAYRIQSKQGQVQLAFQAIQAELESSSRLTQPYLQETLRLRENTLKKVLEIGFRERRVDVRPYLEETPAPVVEFLKGAAKAGGLSQAVVFEGDRLIGYARYREIELPSRYFLQAWEMLGRLGTEGLPLGPFRSVELQTTGQTTILFYARRYLFAFVPDREADLPTLKLNIERELHRLWGPEEKGS